MSEVQEEPSGEPKVGILEWLMPLAFIVVFGWVIWNGAAYVIALPGAEATETALLRRYGPPQIMDWIALIVAPILLAIGVATTKRAAMEWEDFSLADRLSVFIGRVTMVLIALLVGVMFYEVVLRYVFEAPTLWANEMSLWLAVFIFMLSGLYAMQQRSHIRIFLLYDMLPRALQRTCDVISTALIVLFAFFLFWGGYGEAAAKFARWETFGTAFDPPIPATVKPMVLIVVTLVALQAIANLIRDWNREPEIHTAADDIDEEDLKRLRRQVGGED